MGFVPLFVKLCEAFGKMCNTSPTFHIQRDTSLKSSILEEETASKMINLIYREIAGLSPLEGRPLQLSV